MKITCQSCQAKYTIADDKVIGKVVKIRCKKCASTIVVNGTDPSAGVKTESLPPEAPSKETSAESVVESWTVNVTEGDQRSLSEAEIAKAYREGLIDGETYCWRDGMDDWASLREIETLARACGIADAVAPPPEAGRKSSPPQRPMGQRGPANGGSGPTGASSTARRGGGRAPAADLFGSAAQAGGEEDVLTSVPAKLPEVHEDPQTLTGARNENSVLFAISAVNNRNDPDRPPALVSPSEASGLIDIRALSAQLAVQEKKPSRVDDIMNLSSGGAFMPTLAAPDLAPPSLQHYSGGASSAAPSRGRRVVFLALGAGALVVALAIGVTSMLMHGKEPEADATKTAPTSSASAAAFAPAASASAVASAPPVAPTPPPAATNEAPAASAAAPGAVASAAAPPPAAHDQAQEPTAAAHNEHKAAGHEAPTHESAPKAAVVESDQPFNMGEAKARLGATASSVSGCKRPGGPTGVGRVVVVFGTSGAAQSATITGDPFEGTPTGSCVAAKFRGVRVPPFSGSPFSVSKSFTIN